MRDAHRRPTRLRHRAAKRRRHHRRDHRQDRVDPLDPLPPSPVSSAGDAHPGHPATREQDVPAACCCVFVTGDRTVGLSDLRIRARHPPGPHPAPRRSRHHLVAPRRSRRPARGPALRPLSAPRPRPGGQLLPVRGRPAGHRHRFRHRRNPGGGAGLARATGLGSGVGPVVPQPFLNLSRFRRRRGHRAGAAAAGRSLRAVRLPGPSRGCGRRRSGPVRLPGAPGSAARTRWW